MSIASLLASIENDVTNATALQRSLYKGFSGNATEAKNVTRVTAANDEPERVTKVTNLVTAMLPLEAPPVLGCNTVTTVAREINGSGLHAQFTATDEASTDESEAMLIAARAIATAALTDEQKTMRLADLKRAPAMARLWALAWPEAPLKNDDRMVPARTEQATPELE